LLAVQTYEPDWKSLGKSIKWLVAASPITVPAEIAVQKLDGIARISKIESVLR
jgi:hypothetical protein